MELNGATLVYGIIGNPVKHSLSPVLHNYFFSEIRMNAVYVPFALKTQNRQKKCLKEMLKSLSIMGLSVTIPYKKLAYEISDIKDSLSEFTHSSNTIVIQDKLYAYNTDGIGATRALLTKTEINHKSILILGYGGSASAIAGEILRNYQPKNIYITGRNSKKGKQFIRLLKQHISHQTKIQFLEEETLNLEEIDILINTTPIGMKGYPESEYKFFPIKDISKHHIVMDIVYTPIQTPLIKIAKQKKATIIEGYWMFLYQAIEQMKLFTGHYPEQKLILKLKSILLKHLQ